MVNASGPDAVALARACNAIDPSTMAAAIDLVLLDPHWRPRHRIPGGSAWQEMLAALLRLDGRWVAIDQARPEGADVMPSAWDITVTRILHQRLRPMDMVLTDHVIRAGPAHFSFRSAGLL